MTENTNGISQLVGSGIEPVIAKLLANRDVDTPEKAKLFLRGTMNDLPDAGLLPDMDRAVAIILNSVRNGDRVRILGDYDVDGVCATYILTDALKKLGARVDYRIPDRVSDGYGVSRNLVKKAVRDGISLIITVDNGITAVEELAAARKLGLKVIVTDHHTARHNDEGKELLPPADAVVVSKRQDSRYPATPICGTVTALKLVQRLYAKRRCEMPGEYLGLAAIATIADVMPMQGENRIIVSEGLNVLRTAKNPGLAELLEVLGQGDKEISVFSVGYLIGPVINAAGRLESADQVMELFLTQVPERRKEIAEHLKELNDNRKQLTQKGYEAACLSADKAEKGKILILHLPEMHESIAGIVAGKLKDRYHVPAIVLTGTGDTLKGSGRSVQGLSLIQALEDGKELLTRYGGHAMAVGLSIEQKNLAALREHLKSYRIEKAEEEEKKEAEVKVPLCEINTTVAELLELFPPFGVNNPKPTFQTTVQIHRAKTCGKKENVLRFRAGDGTAEHNAVLFGVSEADKKTITSGGVVSISYYPMLNEFGGATKLQLVVDKVLPA